MDADRQRTVMSGEARRARRPEARALRAALSAAVLAMMLPWSASRAQALDRAALALRWAPIHHQDVDVDGDHAVGGKADYITRVDFDGDWNARNNWENTGKFPLRAYAYYSVVETSTHWFILYMFFHPRDWVDHDLFETEHENDAEGVLLTVHRDGSPWGALRSAVTVSHKDFYSYLPEGSPWRAGFEDLDGKLEMADLPDGKHPVTAQEAKGHGLKAHPGYAINGDGVSYFPSTVAEEPDGPNDRNVKYALIDIFGPDGLWHRRNDPQTFANPTALAGDDDESSGPDACGFATFECGTDSANPPWGWDDGNDLPGKGVIATDPAYLALGYFSIPASENLDFFYTYTFNPYVGVVDPPPHTGPWKVMVVGDSMSQGHEGDYTWRYRLWQWFQQQGVPVDFVGPYSGTIEPAHNPGPPPPPLLQGQKPATSAITSGGYVPGTFFDSEHFALWGRQIKQNIDVNPATGVSPIREQVARYQPDLLLVGLGFNDLGWFVGGPRETLDRMKTLVDEARAAKRNVSFAIADVPHRTFIEGRDDLPKITNEYGDLLRDAIPGWSTPDSRVELVEWRKHYDCGVSGCAGGYDGLHPNALGEHQIAYAYERTLHDKYRIGNEVPPIPASDTIPTRPTRTPGNVAAVSSPLGVTVTWERVYGAFGYDVRVRLAGGEWKEERTSSHRYDTRWTQPDMKWEYQVRTHNGGTCSPAERDPCSAWSPIVGATARPETAPAPVGFITRPTATGLDVVWGPPSGPYASTLERYGVIIWDRDTRDSFIETVGVKGLSVHIDGLKVNHRYSVWVESWNAAGGGLPGAARPVIIGQLGTPPTPANFRVRELNGATVELTWTASPGAAGYRTWVRNIHGGSAPVAEQTVVEGATRQEIGFMFDGQWNYEFCVSAVNGDRESPLSACMKAAP